MPARHPLLRAILDAPEDTAARLVYADLLEERGDPRGELIQLQCAIEKAIVHVGISPAVDFPDYDELAVPQELVVRMRKLLAKHQKLWLGDLRPHLRSWKFRRGFVEQMLVDARKFVATRRVLFDVTPLRDLQLSSLSPHLLQAAFDVEELRRLSTLRLDRQRIDPRQAPCFHAKTLDRIENLVLSGNPLDDAGLETLAGAPHFDSLRALDIVGTQHTSRGLEALSKASFFPNLTSLSLGVVGDLGPAIVPMLARGKRLRHLRLVNGALGDEGAIALAASMPSLEHLAIIGDTIGLAGGRALVDSPTLANLTSLHGLLGGDAKNPKLASLLRARFRDVS